MLSISKKDSSPFGVECQKCGHQEWAEVQFSPPWAENYEEVAFARVVVNLQDQKANLKELKALRELESKFSDLPVIEAVKQINSNQVIELGIFPHDEVRELVERARESGLSAELKHANLASMGDYYISKAIFGCILGFILLMCFLIVLLM